MSNVLVIDVGTQSMRGLIFDDKGALLHKEQVKYKPYISKENGYMEQTADMYWSVMCQITQKITSEHADLMKDVIAMSVDTFRDTAVLLDENNNVLRNLILWSDQRVADTSEPLPRKHAALFKLVGMTRTVNAIRSRVKTRWKMQHEPELWQKVRKVVHISAYFNYLLTGNLIDSYASTIGHFPFDFKNKRYLGEKDLTFPVYGLDLKYMIPVCAPGDVMGNITAQCALLTGLPVGLKVIASGSDKGCETVGVGCVESNVASVSFGTTSTVQFSTKKYFEPEKFLPAYPSVLKDYYNPEVQIFRGYWMISWFKQNFARHLEKRAEEMGKSVEEIMNEEIEAIPPGCDGLILQPFWQAGLTTPEARGSIIGFSDYHTRAHVYRAIIEGIDFALREGLERMEKRGKQKIDFIAVSGGGSQSDLICQIAANIFNKPVKRVQTYETSGLGAAIVAFTSCGVFDSELDAIKSMVHYTDVFMPEPTAVVTYDHIYRNIYLKLYAKLQSFYKYLEKE